MAKPVIITIQLKKTRIALANIGYLEVEMNDKPMTATEVELANKKLDKAYEAMYNWAKYFLEKSKQEKKDTKEEN